jgi:sucrose-6-phosphate hydrolase SacC (GH32 family)
MPDGRRVQMAWGRVVHPGMPFTQMMLFPTEFRLKTTAQGIRLQARPIGEINSLHKTAHHVDGASLAQANLGLAAIPPGPLHIKMTFALPHGNVLRLRYQGNTLVELTSRELVAGGSASESLEILIDKTVAEIFLNDGERYIVKQLEPATNNKGLEFDGTDYGASIQSLDVYEMRSVWK